MTTQSSQYDVFISYSSSDREKANPLVKELEDKGYRCFIDYRDLKVGADYSVSIPEVLEQSRCVVLLLTAHANQSKHVRNELDIAFEKQVPIFPMKMDGTDGKQLEWFLRSAQWFDAVDARLDEMVEVIVAKLEDRKLQVAITRKTGFKHKKPAAIAAAVALVSLAGWWTANLQTVDAPLKHTDEQQEWNYPQGLSLTDYEVDDYPFDIRFDLATYSWKVRLDVPEGAHAAAISTAAVSTDKINWQTIYGAGGESTIPSDKLLGSELWVKVSDAKGNRIEPMRIDVNLDELRQQALLGITVESLTPRISFKTGQGWRIEFLARPIDFGSFETHYQLPDGTWYNSQSNRSRFDSEQLAGARHLAVKFVNPVTGEQTNSVTIEQDLTAMAYETYYAEFDGSKVSMNCRGGQCDMSRYTRNAASMFLPIQSVEFGVNPDALDFTHTIDFADSYLMGDNEIKQDTRLTFKAPNCGPQLYYRFALKNGAQSDIHSVATRLSECDAPPTQI